MCAMYGPVYVFHWWPCICVLWMSLYICFMVTMYMYALGGPVYVYYEISCMCVLWDVLYMYAMGGPAYGC